MDEFVKAVFAALDQTSKVLRRPDDVDTAAKALQDKWGGECGDDLDAQLLCAVLLRACFSGAHANALVDSITEGFGEDS